jgi:2-haloacid dehalogenase
MSVSNPPKAFLTDVFGTVVDWRATVTNHLTKSAEEVLNSPARSLPSATRAAASTVSWPDFAQAWRNTYYHFTRSYTPSATVPFKSVDQHHLDSLIKLLSDHGISDLFTETEIHKLSLIWHFLDPWPDSSAGLGQLNDRGFITATLSNGNTSLLEDLAKHGSLPYTSIVSAEDFGAYKPHPDVYLGAAKKLGFKPEECCLVAAHLGDLKAAKGCGYQACYIERKQEEGWPQEKAEEAKKEGWVDMWVTVEEDGFKEVARRFAGRDKGGKL